MLDSFVAVFKAAMDNPWPFFWILAVFVAVGVAVSWWLDKGTDRGPHS